MADRNYNLAITASDGFSGAFRKLLDQVQQSESATQRLRSAFYGLTAALGVSVSFAGLASMLKSTIDAAARLDDLSERTGAAVEELSRFAGVARITGQDLGAVESAMSKLSKSIVEAQDGTSNAARAFKALGINIRDAAGNLKNSGFVMDELARKQQNFADGAGKVAAMAELGGKSMDGLIPYLNDYVRLSEQVAVTTADEAKAAEDFNIQLGVMTEGFNKLLREALLPSLGKFNQLMRTASELRGEFKLFDFNPFEALNNYLQKAIEKQVWWATWFRQTFENFKTLLDHVPGSGPLKTSSASAAADAAVLTLRNKQLADATRELPPLMESTAKATGKAAVAFTAAGDKAKYVNTWFDEMQRLAKQLDEELATSKKYWDDLAKTMERAGDVSRRHDEAMQKEVETLAEQLKKTKEEGEEIGLTQKALDALTLSRLDSNIARLEEQILVAKNIEGMESEVAVLEQQLQLHKQIRDATANNQTRQAIADAAEKAADAWKKTAESIQESLTDALLRGFESGKDFAKNLRDTLVNMFKTLVLRPIIQAVLAPVAGGLGGLFGGTANASSGAAGILGGLGGAGNWLSTLFGGIGNASMAGPIIPTFGSSFLGGAMSPFSTIAQLFSGGTSAFGGMTGALGAGLGAALPVVGIGLAIASALGLFDRGGPKTGGSASSTADIGLGTVVPGGIDRLFTPNQRDEAMQTIATQVANDYMTIARSLGLSTGAASFGFGFDTDPEGTAGNRVSARAMVNGQQVYGVTDRDLGREGDYNAALAEEASRALLAALQASSLPDYLANLFNTLDVETATPEQINALVQTAAALRIAVDALAGLGDQFAAMDPADVREFVESFGGLEQFMQRFAYIADNFYTDAQKLEKATEALSAGFADLGIQVPDTHQAFLDLLNGLDLTTEEGREMYEAISALAPLFVQVRGTAQQAADALGNVVDELDEVASAANTIDLGSIGAAARTEFERIMDNISNLAGNIGGSLGDQLSLQIRLINGEIARLTAALGTAWPGGAEWQAIDETIAHLRWALNATTGELARFTVLAAQYDAGRASELMALERWYGQQQALFAGNAQALAALNDTFQKRWKEIIDGVGTGVGGVQEELKRLRESLKDYLAGLTLRNDLSPLSPAAKLAEAQKRYQELLTKAQGGDVEALREIQNAADAYLRLAREMFASGGSYTSIFEQVVEALNALANPPQTGGPEPIFQHMADAMPTGSPIASQADVEQMALAIIHAIREGATTQATAAERSAERVAVATRPLK